MSEYKRYKTTRTYTRNIRQQENRADSLITRSGDTPAAASLEAQLARARSRPDDELDSQSSTEDHNLPPTIDLPDIPSHHMNMEDTSPLPFDENDDEDSIAELSAIAPLNLEYDFALASNHDDEVSPIDSIVESFGITTDTPHPTGTFSEEEEQPLNKEEKAMLDLLILCKQAGTPVGFYNQLLTMLRRKIKDGVQLAKLKGRDTFLSVLRTKVHSPRPKVSTNLPGQQIVKFSFLEQLIDLLGSSRFDDLTNLCANEDPQKRFNAYEPAETDKDIEVLGSSWYQKTCEKLDLGDDHNGDILGIVIPVILYADKTGKDAFQRYPLEPWMFTVANLRLECREDSSAWRHLGFLPPLSDYGSAEQGCQLYHDCLEVLLHELHQLQQVPPELLVNLGGMKRVCRVHLPICIITGNQKSQDNVLGRRPVNSGGCGRIHRSCMCSQITSLSTDGCHPCHNVDSKIVLQLQQIAMMDEDDPTVDAWMNEFVSDHSRPKVKAFISRRSTVARQVLQKTYSMYAVKNAFTKMDFGANQNGVFSATVDDIMHFHESGYFLYLAQVAYLSMVDKERESIEEVIRRQTCIGIRSSVRLDYPRIKSSSGFSSVTLLSAGEKVGASFALFLALHTEDGVRLFEKSVRRQQQKYLFFPSADPNPDKQPTQKKNSKKNKTQHETVSGLANPDTYPL